MSRNLVLFCDGTANKFGEKNTNVVRVVQCLVRDDDRQIVYYDPGVGTMPGPGLVTRVGKFVSKLVDLAFATGLDRNVEEAYTFVINHYEPGDKVYLFGFSRGAYTARVVAALLHHVGLLPRGSENLIPYALRLLRVARKDNRGIADQFRATFARPIDGNPDRRFPVHFVGVWDTVSSVGWFWEPAKFAYTATNPGISIIRHAISIDERRAFYRQNRFARANDVQDLQQLWFAGVHSDVGGGYPDTTINRCSFDWMVDEAETAGLRIDPARRAVVAPPVPEPWLAKQHNELKKPWWWPLELFPKIHWNSSKRRNSIRLNFFRSRKLFDGELLHESTLLRIRDSDYTPASLSREFRKYVRSLPTVPKTLAYRK
ncbi:MAG TPA: DUF2235 domain-containing protein [Thermoanaerobaculia bacterium]|jgi:uncharacterized protein (DUF2235 family)|nr:DUF2235 domain-containing protein [Thermoanaerobaculia bacterium]